MAEWLMAAVLKTAVRETVSGVRIPLPPPTPLRGVVWREWSSGIAHRARSVRLGTNPRSLPRLRCARLAEGYPRFRVRGVSEGTGLQASRTEHARCDLARIPGVALALAFAALGSLRNPPLPGRGVVWREWSSGIAHRARSVRSGTNPGLTRRRCARLAEELSVATPGSPRDSVGSRLPRRLQAPSPGSSRCHSGWNTNHWSG